MIPVIQVSHIPSTSSFYAAIIQPFGVRFLSASNTSSGRYIEFGFPAFTPSPSETVCILHERIQPTPAVIHISSVIVGVVEDFYERALKAADFSISHSLTHTADQSVARITDFDGNMIEARYNRRQSLPGPGIAIHPKQDQRVLNWQYDVARSINSTEEDPLQTRRQLPRASTLPLSSRAYRSIDAGQGHLDAIVPGMSNQALIGTILGAAAGAAVAYAMVKSEEPSRPLPERRRSYHDHRRVHELAPRDGAVKPDVTAARILEIEHKLDNIWSEQGSHMTKSQHVVRYEPVQDSKTSLAPDAPSATRSVANPTVRMHDNSRRLSAGPRHSSRHEVTTNPQLLAITSRSTAVSSATRHTGPAKVVHEESISQPRSYVSARSSASTAKPKSKFSNTARSERSPKGKNRSSVVSARLVALPESVVGSVAPSDSISCVGSRRDSQNGRRSEKGRLRNRV